MKQIKQQLVPTHGITKNSDYGGRMFLRSLAIVLLCLAASLGARSQASFSTYTISASSTTFQSIASSGQRLWLENEAGSWYLFLDDEDAGWGIFSLPFNLPFGETTIPQGTSLFASVNGYLFLNGELDAAGDPFTGIDELDYAVAYQCDEETEYQRDLFELYGNYINPLFDGDGLCEEIYYKDLSSDADDPRFVVEWKNLTDKDGGCTATYQLVIHKSGDIDIVVGQSAACRVAVYLYDYYEKTFGSVGTTYRLTGSWGTPTWEAGNPQALASNPEAGTVVTLTRPAGSNPPDDPTPAITCPAPTDLRIAAVADHQMTLAWNEAGEATRWEIEYATANFTPGTNAYEGSATTGDNPFTLTNLQPSTTYYLYLRSLCADDDQSDWVSFTQSTTCEAVATLPYREDFESYSNYGSDPCWVRYEKSAGYDVRTDLYPCATSTHYEGEHGLQFYQRGAGVQYMALPPFGEQLGRLSVSFVYRQSSNNRFDVCVAENPYDTTTFTSLWHCDTATNGWLAAEVNLRDYAGTGRHIVLRYRTSGFAIFYLDNLEVYKTSSCARLENLSVADVQTDRLTLDWTDEQAASWVVEYADHNITPGSGEGMTLAAGSHPYELTGLSAQTRYYLYVRGVCPAPANDSSRWVQTVQYTACGDISRGALPYKDDFEAYIDDKNPCWQAYEGTVGNAPDSSITRYPAISIYTRYEGSRSLYLYPQTGRYQYLVLPRFEQSVDAFSMTFMFNQSRANTLEVCVAVDPSDPATFTTLYSHSEATNGWIPASVDLGSYSGDEAHYVVLRYSATATGYSVYIDNIEISNCVKPRDFAVVDYTDSQLQLAWTEQGNASQWVLEYADQAITPGQEEGTTLAIDENPYTLTGLDPQTTYHLYLRSLCGEGDSSRWVSTTARTACSEVEESSLPWSDDFEAGTLSECYQRFLQYGSEELHADNDYPTLTADDSYAMSGHALSFYQTGMTTNYIVLPLFESNLRDLLLSFALNQTANYTYFNVFAAVNPADPSTFDTLYTHNGPTEGWERVEVAMRGYHGNGRYLVLHYRKSSYATGTQCYVDDLLVSLLPECEAPTDFEVAATDIDQLTLTWNGDNATTYVVRYGEEAGQPTSTLHTRATSHAVTALVPDKEYHFQLAAVCHVGDTSAPVLLTASTDAEQCDSVALTLTAATDSTLTFAIVGLTEGETLAVAYRAEGDPTFTPAADCTTESYTLGGLGMAQGYTLRFTRRCRYSSTVSTIAAATSCHPVNLRVSNITPTTATLSWDNPCGEVSQYNVTYISDDDRATDFAYDTTHTLIDLADNTSYRIVVEAEGDGTYSTSDTLRFTTQLACHEVENLRTTHMGAHMAQIEWESPADSFRVVYAIGSETRDTLVGTRELLITGLDASSSYDLYVTAVCLWCNDRSEASQLSFTTNDAYTECDFPIIDVAATADSSITLSAEVNDGSELLVEYRLADAEDWATAPACASETYTLEGLPMGQSYEIRMGHVCLPDTVWSLSVYASTTCHLKGLTATQPTTDGITLSWDDLCGGTGNYLIIYTANGEEQSVGAGSSPFTLSGLQDNTTYTVRVQPDGEAAMVSNPVSFTTLPDCAEVRFAQALSVASSTATLVWNTEADSVLVRYGQQRQTVRGNGVTLSGLTHGSSYEVTLYAYCYGDTVNPAHISFTTLLDTCHITDLAVSDITTSTATIRWSDSRGDATAYNVILDDGSSERRLTATGGSLQLSGLNDNTTYTVRIVPVGSSADVLLSDTLRFTTLPDCATIDNLTASQIATTSALLRWITRAERSVVVCDGRMQSTTEDSLILAGLSSNSTYTATVYAYCYGDSVNPAHITFTTLPDTCRISGTTAADITATTATLTWNDNRGDATSYRVHISDGSNTQTVAATGQPFELTGLDDNTTYRVSVEPVGSHSDVVISDTATFTTQPICHDIYDLLVSDTTTSTARLSWVTEADSVLIRFEGQEITVAGNSYTLAGLTPATAYSAIVYAYCYGVPAMAQEVEFTTASITPVVCGEVADIEVEVNATRDTAWVGWTAGLGNTSFEVEYGVKNYFDEPYEIADEYVSGVGTSRGTLAVRPATCYQLNVRGVCDSLNKSEWMSLSFCVDSLPNDNPDPEPQPGPQPEPQPGDDTTHTNAIHTIASALQATLAPVPAHDYVALTVAGVDGLLSIDLVDMTGRTVRHFSANCTSECRHQIDLRGVPAGSYFVRLTSHSGNLVRRLVVR